MPGLVKNEKESYLGIDTVVVPKHLSDQNSQLVQCEPAPNEKSMGTARFSNKSEELVEFALFPCNCTDGLNGTVG